MAKIDNLMGIAIFLMVLIISIPIVSIRIYALSSIEITKVSGPDNHYYIEHGMIVGVIRNGDPLTVQARGVLQDDSIVTFEQLHVSLNGMHYYSSDSCTGRTVGSNYEFECSKTFNPAVILNNPQSGGVRLYNTLMSPILDAQFRIVVDNQPPKIEFTTTPAGLAGSTLTLDYRISDSYTQNPTYSYCAGLESVIITMDGTQIHSEPITSHPQCELSGSFVYHPSMDGAQRYCVVARDRFGQESSSCRNVLIDTSPPQTVGITLTYQGSDDEVRYLSSTGSLPVTMRVRFDSSDLNFASVEADISSVSNHFGFTRASCMVVGTESHCFWNFNAILSGAVTPSIPIRYSDYAGNFIEEQLNLNSIMVDNTGPVITRIETQYGQIGDGTYRATQVTTFIAQINDYSFNLMRTELDLFDVFGYQKRLSPDECIKQGSSTYMCYWYNVTLEPQRGDGVYFVGTYGTMDDFGNIRANENRVDITIDGTPPDVESVYIEVVHANPEVYQNRTVAGDFLRVHALVRESGNIVRAHSNLTDIGISGDQPFNLNAGGCTRNIGGVNNNTHYNCTMLSAPIADTAGGIKTLLFNFFDEFSNRANVTAPIYVYKIAEGESSYWDVSVQCSPKMIDRQMALITNMWTYCPIRLTPKNNLGTYKPLSVTLRDCSESGDEGYVHSYQIFNNIYSNYPYLKLTYYDTLIEEDFLSYNCTLDIMTEIQTEGRILENALNSSVYHYIYPGLSSYPEIREILDDAGLRSVSGLDSYETVDISFNIGFFDNDLMHLSDAYKMKIQDVLDGTAVGMTWIEKYEEFAALANSICSIVQLVVGIANIINTIVGVLQALESTYLAALVQALKAFNSLFNFTTGTLFGYLIRFCGFMACDWTILDFFLFDNSGQAGGASVMGYFNSLFPEIGDCSNPDRRDLCVTAFPDNPKDSCVLSIATLCIPGIIDCLSRWRQIQCIYGDCLVTGMKAGVPMDLCEDMHSYLECKYIMDEIFDVIPWVGTAKMLMKQLAEALTDPLGIAMILVNVVVCRVLPAAAHSACHWVQLIMKEVGAILSMINQMSQMGDTMFSPGYDACGTFFTNAQQAGFEVPD